jgi:O-antigen/teichoic acid export membrane protein
VRLLAGRAGWNIADQIVSSGTNFVLSILVARTLTADGFGNFSVAFTIYTLLFAAGRALIAQPLVVRYASAHPDGFMAAGRSATAAALLLGIGSGTVTGIAGVVIGGPLGLSLVCMGFLLPGLLLQDMWRAVFVTQGRPSAAFLNDVLWGVAQFAALAAVLWSRRESATAVLLAWGGAALLAALVGGLQFGAHPRIRGSVRWMAGQRDLLGYYAATFALTATNQVALLLIGAVGTPSDLGAIRAALVVLGPLSLVTMSLATFATPEVSRRQLRGRAALRIAISLSTVLVVIDLIWGFAVIALPDRVGAALLGDSWTNAQAVLPATLLGVVAMAVAFGAHVLLWGHGYAREAFRASAVQAPAFLLLGLGGLLLGNAPGAALGLALAQWVIVPIVWWQAVNRMRGSAGAGQRPERDAGTSPPEHEAGTSCARDEVPGPDVAGPVRGT